MNLILEAKLGKPINNPFEWKLQETTIIDGDKISVFLGGVAVKGRITHRSGGLITLQIEEPYQNLIASWSINNSARAKLSFDGIYGDYKAEELLSRLYGVGKCLSDNFEKIKEQYYSVMDQPEIKRVCVRIEQISKDINELRRLMRMGEIVVDRDFNKRIQLLKMDRKNCALSIRERKSRTLRTYFDNSSCIPLRQIIDIVEGRISLKSINEQYKKESQ